MSTTLGTGKPSYFPTFDGNGNVSEYLTSAGATVAHYEYDPFGRSTTSTGTLASSFAHRFSTKPVDGPTGLYYYGYRSYDPVTGRWPSRDPIGEEGGINVFAFVRSDGVNHLDYLGNVDIMVTINRRYLEFETIGEFTAVALSDEVSRCCAPVSGQTLELKRGKYATTGGPGIIKDYPIHEGERDGIYSKSDTTSIDGQIDERNDYIRKWNKRHPGNLPIPLYAYPVLPGNIATHNIDVITDKFSGTRMHQGSSAMSSLGCPIVGDKMRLGWVPNTRYPTLPDNHPLIRREEVVDPNDHSKKMIVSYLNIHQFPAGESVNKIIELNTFVECVQEKVGGQS